MKSPAEPAFIIPLRPDELALIGEICAIQGQIEFLLQHAVKILLQLDHDSMLKVMASNSIRTNSDAFVAVARHKCPNEETRNLAEEVFSKIANLSTGRNDFVHAMYARKSGGGFSISAGDALPILENIVAVRTKNRSQRKVSDIQLVRDEAARISCALAHLGRLLTVGNNGQSPWRGKF